MSCSHLRKLETLHEMGRKRTKTSFKLLSLLLTCQSAGEASCSPTLLRVMRLPSPRRTRHRAVEKLGQPVEISKRACIHLYTSLSLRVLFLRMPG